MSNESLEDLLKQLETPSTPAEDEKSVVEPESTTEPDKVEEDDNPLAGLLVGETDEPKPEPVKKKRGRPKGSGAKAKTDESADSAPAPESVDNSDDAKTENSTTSEESDDRKTEALVLENATPVSNTSATGSFANVNVTNVFNQDEAYSKSKDIYILSETQILNGSIYRRGQKITFTKGDAFYNSQTDRNGNNWLDFVDDLDAQYAYFGRVIVQPDRWTGIPIGSTEGVEHPGIALALAKIAQEEYERNGVPFN